MCAYYEDTLKIKKGDKAQYYTDTVLIVSTKHIKENKTMDIVYILDTDVESKEYKINVPYKTSDFGFILLERQAD